MNQHWLQKPVIPFMILAIILGSTQALWHYIYRIQFSKSYVVPKWVKAKCI